MCMIVEGSDALAKQFKKDSIVSMSSGQLCLLGISISLMIIAVGSMADWFVTEDRAP